MKPDRAHSRTCEEADCLVCASWRAEKRQQAVPFLMDRVESAWADQTTLTKWEEA